MSTLIWDAPGARGYEIGVDHGVLYPDSTYGVPWNGLKAVTEKPEGGRASSYYLDGQKMRTTSAVSEYAATIEAFSAPPEFAICDGIQTLSVGLSQTHQKRQRFGFSYRTNVGNDITQDSGYKIHLVYNALAQPSERAYTSRSDSADPLTLSWDIQAVAPLLTGAHPTAHLVYSSKIHSEFIMTAIEDILYGTDTTDARLPTLAEVEGIIQRSGMGYGHGPYGQHPYGHA